MAWREDNRRTRDTAADRAGFDNAKTYEQAKAVVDHGVPELALMCRIPRVVDRAATGEREEVLALFLP